MNLTEIPKELRDWINLYLNLPNPSYYEIFGDKDTIYVIPAKECKPIKVVFINE